MQQPQVWLVFLCCHGAAIEHQVLHQTYKNSYRNTKNAGSCLWKRSYLSHTCILTVWNIQRWMWGPLQCSRCGWTSTAWWNLWTTAEVHELVARDCQIILKLMNDQLYSHWETRCQILHNYLGKRMICIKSVPHSFMNGIEEESACKDFTHINQSHTFRTASLLGFQYNHEIIYQIMDWRTKSLRPKQFYVQKLRTKMMLLLLTNRVWSTNH